MASYNIVFKPSIEKDLRFLPKSVIVRVLRQIERVLGEGSGEGSGVRLAMLQFSRVRLPISFSLPLISNLFPFGSAPKSFRAFLAEFSSKPGKHGR